MQRVGWCEYIDLMSVACIVVVYLFKVYILALIIGYDLLFSLCFRAMVGYGVVLRLILISLKMITKLLCDISYSQKEIQGYNQHYNKAYEKDEKYKS